MKDELNLYLEERGLSAADMESTDYYHNDFKSWQADRKIKLGDLVTITTQGRRVTGKVIYRDYDVWENSWDIELEFVDGTTARWKSAYDAGSITEVIRHA